MLETSTFMSDILDFFLLAKGCLEFYFSIVSQPGGRERLDAWKAEHLRKETRT